MVDEIAPIDIGNISHRVVVNLSYIDFKINIDFANTPILSSIIKFINNFLSTKDNGQAFTDEIDQFLNNCNEITSNITGSTINAMSKFFDDMDEKILSSGMPKTILSGLKDLNAAMRNNYSASALDFASHLMGNLFDQLDNPQSMFKLISDDIDMLLNSKEIKVPDVSKLFYIENMVGIVSGHFTELVNSMKGIASVPILSSFKQSLSALSSGTEGIVSLYKNISSAVSSIEQQFSKFDFFPYDVIEKINNLDIMDITNLMNKIYRVVGHNLLMEFHEVISAIASLDLSVGENVSRLKLIISGHFSTLLGNISDGINGTAEKLNDYLENLLPNLLSMIPRLIQNLSEVCFTLISTIVSKIGDVVQGLFNMVSDYDVNTSSTATIDNPEGNALVTISNDEVTRACTAIRELNDGLNMSISFSDKSKSVIYIIDTGLNNISVFADCVNGKLIRVLSFTNVSKYKGYESIARSSKSSYPSEVIDELNKLAVAEETIRTLSVLDQGPK
jgi:predicted PurR-regulated permease PerM